MIAKTVLVPVLALFAITAIPSRVYAQTITVDFGGECNNKNITNAPSPVILSDSTTNPFDCGDYRIVPKSSSSGSARIEVLNSGSDDVLQLLNAKITRPGADATALHITMSASTFTPDPPAGATVWYQINMQGAFAKSGGGLAGGSQIKSKGFLQHPPPDPNPWLGLGISSPTATELVHTVCGTTPCSQNNAFYATTYFAENPFPNLNTNRALKSEVWITLAAQNSHSLGLTQVMTFPTQGGGPPEPPEPPQPPRPPQQPRSLFCTTTDATLRAFGCPQCVSYQEVAEEHVKVQWFAKSNWENLSQDIAQGQGEHLASLATLLHIPGEEHPAFFSLAQDQYQVLARQGVLTSEQMLVALHETMAGNPNFSKLR